MALVKQELPTYDDGLETLVEIFKAVQLGEEDGLRALAGDLAAQGYRSRVAVRKRQDFHDRPLVQQIGKEKWAQNPTATFKEILNSVEIKRFKYAERTLQIWLRAVDPRPLAKKRGRPLKHK